MAVAVSSGRGGATKTNSSDSSSYISNSQAWTSSSLWVVCIHNDIASGTATSPSLSSNSPVGISWTFQTGKLFNGNLNRLSVYTAYGDGNTGTLTASFSGVTQTGCNIDVLEVTGGAAATSYINQTATGSGTSTSANVGTVSSWSDATNNAGILCVGEADQSAISAEAGWTEIDTDIQHNPPIGRNADFFIVGQDTTPTATIAASKPWGAVFLEIVASVGGGGGGTGIIVKLGRSFGTAQAQRRASRW